MNENLKIGLCLVAIIVALGLLFGAGDGGDAYCGANHWESGDC